LTVQVKKVLILRFSSIGDIVLTTPVIRCASRQLKDVEIHMVTKEAFRPVIAHNPYLHRVHTFKKEVSELYEVLRAEKYDVIIDLHHNLRSLRLKRKLGVKSYSFNKLNVQKFLAVNFKMLNKLPDRHIVDRYFDAIAPLGVKNDGEGLDYFIEPTDEVNINAVFPSPPLGGFVALVVGGSYYTKKIPLNKLSEICARVQLPIIVLGGKEDKPEADQLKAQFPQLINGCGAYSLNQSASIIRQAAWVITSDTGLMHMASAFRKKIISVWGNTIPEFGMAPYLPLPESKILEVKGLSCRPCSKLGYHQCPLGHFKCMNDQDLEPLSRLDE
jgi:ADP-heptose:LPS heptosyltransferase